MKVQSELRYRCIVFDLDGTLLDTRPAMLAAINAQLAKLSRPPVGAAQLEHATHQGLPAMWLRALDETGRLPPPEQIAATQAELRQRYLRAAAQGVMPFPGALALLDALRERGVWMAICSNQNQDSVAQLLDLFDLRRYFREVVGGDTFVERKPDPMALRWLMLCARSAPETTLMVGDSALDGECAERAGAEVVLMGHGYGGPELSSRFAMLPGFAELHRQLFGAPPC